MEIALDPGVLRRIDAIDWFLACENGGAYSVFRNVVWLDSWQRARESYTSVHWENMRIEAGNALTVHLARRFPREYTEWNRIVDLVKCNTVFVDAMAKVVRMEAELEQELLPHVRWDILSAIMESAYAKCHPPAPFYLKLLQLYEEGHFPCGWEGEWPEGRLVAI